MTFFWQTICSDSKLSNYDAACLMIGLALNFFEHHIYFYLPFTYPLLYLKTNVSYFSQKVGPYFTSQYGYRYNRSRVKGSTYILENHSGIKQTDVNHSIASNMFQYSC